jgi:hypothetical protein
MVKPTNTRIYIFDGDTRYDFLWGDAHDDGSVYFGLTGRGNQKVEQITVGSDYAKDANNMVFHPYVGPHKVSFHSSGMYTLSNYVEHGDDVKRLVVHGIPLTEVIEPVRMMDVIVPKRHLRPTGKSLPNVYIDLKANLREQTHFCCTVFCMPISMLSTFGEDCVSIIRGATWESKNALTSGNNAWAFTLHDSVHQSMRKDYSLISINGCVTDNGKEIA